MSLFHLTLRVLPLILAIALARTSAAQGALTGVEQARLDSIRRPYTAPDIEFMSGMIHHHAQAVKMAGMCPTHGANASLAIFCRRIARAQSAEIELMQAWLRDRNQVVPEPDPRGMKMMHGGIEHVMPMPGMLSDAQIAGLDSARGVEFDRLFLTFMIRHHEGAIAMVDSLFNTPNAAHDEIVFKFANDVHADQSTEIDRMQQMLSALPPLAISPYPVGITLTGHIHGNSLAHDPGAHPGRFGVAVGAEDADVPRRPSIA